MIHKQKPIKKSAVTVWGDGDSPVGTMSRLCEAGNKKTPCLDGYDWFMNTGSPAGFSQGICEAGNKK